MLARLGGQQLYAVGESNAVALCLASRDGFTDASVGFVGASDGWQDLSQHGRLTWSFSSVDSGNVAMTAGLEGAEGVIALAISVGPTGARTLARTLARSALAEGFDAVRKAFVADWRGWGGGRALRETASCTGVALARWRHVDTLPAGRALVIEDAKKFALHFGWDGWKDASDREAVEGAFGFWRVCFEPNELAARQTIEFTRRRLDGWEKLDHSVRLSA